MKQLSILCVLRSSLLSFALTSGAFVVHVSAADKPSRSAVMPQKHFALLENYCLDCHDNDTQKGKLNLETLSFEISKDIPTAEHWDNILAALNSKEMPPENKRQIPGDEKAAFLSDLAQQMVVARNVLGDSGGEITMRRLNRREYQNTLETLVGFQPDVSDLPNDDSPGGFDTSGASLFFSSDQFEQYRATAKRALTYALRNAKRPAPQIIRHEGEKISEEIIEKSKDRIETFEQAKAFLEQKEKPPTAFGFRDVAHAKKQFIRAKPDYEALKYFFLDRPETKTGVVLRRVKKVPGLRYKPPYAGGTYKIRVRAGAYEDAPERRRYLTYTFFASNTDERVLGHAKITGTIANPEIVEFEIEHPADVRGSFDFEQRNYEDRASQYFIDQQWKTKNGHGEPPALWVDYVEIEGPFFKERAPSIVAKIVQPKTANESNEVYARKTLARFATRAFRGKKPESEFIDKLVAWYLAKRNKGAYSKEAMIDTLALVLSSPSFLYLIEPRGEHEKPVRLSDRELAIRLSYFLWSTPPDAKLMAAAKDGSLSDPATLRSQTARLLNDRRVDRFVSSFAHQWLDMTRIDMFDFDAKFHPLFDDAVRYSARQEVYATIRHAMDQQLPIASLLKSDFVVVNDVLADFYELRGVTGPGFRPVKVAANSPRGGFLGMAATHIMGSDGQRSSPVERGAWVLRHLLNDPPPPAPPNVPMLEHEDAVLPIRDLQKRHQEEPQCASCHRKIDPIGYGLENFTAAGLWRDVEEVEVNDPKITGNRKRRFAPNFKHFPINPSGTLPSGENFNNYHELRETIASGHGDAFARGFAEHLIAYALGRPYGISDHNLATKITTKASQAGNTIPAFIHALVQSKAFQLK